MLNWLTVIGWWATCDALVVGMTVTVEVKPYDLSAGRMRLQTD
jgi:hypothetical protein